MGMCFEDDCDIPALRAEIERLQTLSGDLGDRLNEHVAEIEKLRGALSNTVAIIDELHTYEDGEIPALDDARALISDSSPKENRCCDTCLHADANGVTCRRHLCGASAKYDGWEPKMSVNSTGGDDG